MKPLRKLLLMDKHTCPWWFGYTFDNPLRRLFHDPESIFESLVKEGQTVADVGCGLGYFSLGLARMVGRKGRVQALDIQPEMLARAGSRAKRHGLSDIIDFRLSDAGRLGLEGPVDFVLAFWMVHEVGDPKAFLAEIRSALKPGGRFLMVEPKVHVPRGKFFRSVELARSVGFQVESEPKVWFSRSTLFSSASAPAG